MLAGYRADPSGARAALSDPDPAVRAAGLASLERLERLTVDDLHRHLADPAPAVRRAAAGLAAGMPEVDLLPALADKDPLVVEACVWSLGEQGRRDAVPALGNLARRADDPLVREAAVAALGAIGDPDGVAFVLEALREDVATVRRRAAVALAAFEGAEVDEALRRALEDRDWQVRSAAEELLGTGPQDRSLPRHTPDQSPGR